IPAVFEDVACDLVAEFVPGCGELAPVVVGEFDRPVDGHPAHHPRVDAVSWHMALLPDAVVRFGPAPSHRFCHGAHELPVLVAEVTVYPGDVVDELDHRAEHVELYLMVGEVADP